MHLDLGNKRLLRQSADSDNVYEADGDVYIRLSITADKILTRTHFSFQNKVYHVEVFLNRSGHLLFKPHPSTPTYACVDVISQEGIILGHLKRDELHPKDPVFHMGEESNDGSASMENEEINPILQQARSSGACLFLKVKPPIKPDSTNTYE